MATVNNDTIRNSMLDGIRTDAVFNNGHIRIRRSDDTMLAELDYSADAFDSAAATGSMTSNTVTAEASAVAAGDATHVDLETSADASQLECTVGVGSGEFQFSGSLTIASGDEVSLTGNTHTISFA